MFIPQPRACNGACTLEKTKPSTRPPTQHPPAHQPLHPPTRPLNPHTPPTHHFITHPQALVAGILGHLAKSYPAMLSANANEKRRVLEQLAAASAAHPDQIRPEVVAPVIYEVWASAYPPDASEARRAALATCTPQVVAAMVRVAASAGPAGEQAERIRKQAGQVGEHAMQLREHAVGAVQQAGEQAVLAEQQAAQMGKQDVQALLAAVTAADKVARLTFAEGAEGGLLGGPGLVFV